MSREFGGRAGGRLVTFTVYTNIDGDDGDLEAMAKSMGRATRAAVVTTQIHDGKTAKRAWDTVREFAANAADDPGVKLFSDLDSETPDIEAQPPPGIQVTPGPVPMTGTVGFLRAALADVDPDLEVILRVIDDSCTYLGVLCSANVDAGCTDTPALILDGECEP